MTAVVQSTGSGNGVTNAGSISQTLNGVAAGNLLVAMVSIFQADNTVQGAITPTDTNGSWSDASSDALDVDGANLVRNGVMCGYQKNCASGSHTVTYTFTSTAVYAEMVLVEVSGCDTAAPFDSTVTSDYNASMGAGGAPAARPHVVTTSAVAQAHNFIIAGFEAFAANSDGTHNAGITDPPTNFTSFFAQQDDGSTLGAELCYWNRTGNSGTVTASWNWTDIWNGSTGLNDVVGRVAVFKATAGDTLMPQAWM